MQHRSLRYHAYLIRLWEDGTPGAWRASAQQVQSGETVRFVDAAQLFAFLQAQMQNTTLSNLPVANEKEFGQAQQANQTD
jgi:hypothetical protein